MKIKINNNKRTSAEKTYKIQNNNQLIIKRPVLIISENDINELLNIVNIIPITSLKPGRIIYPNEISSKLIQREIIEALSFQLGINID